MDTDGLRSLFIAQSRETLEGISLSMMRLEESPDDKDAIDELFRFAHSLKGMTATMGLERMAALTHEMEDVLDLLRQRAGGLSREAIDTLLTCADALSGAVDRYEDDGEERLESSALVARLGRLVRRRSAEQEAERARFELLEKISIAAQGQTVAHVVLALDDQTEMPGIRAFMAINALRRHGEVLGSVPAEDAIDGFGAKTIEVWVATQDAHDALAATAGTVPDVTGAQAQPADLPDPPVPAAIGRLAERARRRTSSTVRLETKRLDDLADGLADLASQRARLEDAAARFADPELTEALVEVTRAAAALQDLARQMRMVAVDQAFLPIPRLVRDLSGKLGKRCALHVSGEDTELDRAVVESLNEPLVHLIRNALDHGIEPAEEREAAGKDWTGNLEVWAEDTGTEIIIGVRDDGRGIDPVKVGQIAVQRGLISPADADGLDVKGAADLLFRPGFSTAAATTDVSGRGVGLDAVRDAVESLGGTVTLTAAEPSGTFFRIVLPRTAGVAAAVVARRGDLFVAVPADRVEEVTETTILVRRAGGNVAFDVDEVLGRRDLVLRPLAPDADPDVPAFARATLGPGEDALLVDCDALEDARLTLTTT